jgi:hypothetical protein
MGRGVEKARDDADGAWRQGADAVADIGTQSRPMRTRFGEGQAQDQVSRYPSTTNRQLPSAMTLIPASSQRATACGLSAPGCIQMFSIP